MPKTKPRPQSPKSRSIVAREAILRSGAGVHRKQGEYRRKPKHSGRGWDDE